jgi:hypothetical protein
LSCELVVVVKIGVLIAVFTAFDTAMVVSKIGVTAARPNTSAGVANEEASKLDDTVEDDPARIMDIEVSGDDVEVEEERRVDMGVGNRLAIKS